VSGDKKRMAFRSLDTGIIGASTNLSTSQIDTKLTFSLAEVPQKHCMEIDYYYRGNSCQMGLKGYHPLFYEMPVSASILI
jgi:hypothetical protein